MGHVSFLQVNSSDPEEEEKWSWGHPIDLEIDFGQPILIGSYSWRTANDTPSRCAPCADATLPHLCLACQGHGIGTTTLQQSKEGGGHGNLIGQAPFLCALWQVGFSTNFHNVPEYIQVAPFPT